VDVEGHERRAGGDEDRAPPSVDACGAEVGAQLAGRDPVGQGRDAAAAQLGPRAPAREEAVEEHRQPLGADEVGREQRLGARRPAPCVVEEHDRRHVERPDVRMAAARRRQVDPLGRRPAPAASAGASSPGPAGEREHAAVVVGVAVGVEQARTGRGEGRADGLDGRGVAPLGDVRDGEQHARQLGRDGQPDGAERVRLRSMRTVTQRTFGVTRRLMTVRALRSRAVRLRAPALTRAT
jgi:hypothetical protein